MSISRTKELKEVSGYFHVSAALPPGTNPDISVMEGRVGPRTGVDVLDKRKNLLFPPGFETRTVQLVAEYCIEYVNPVPCLIIL